MLILVEPRSAETPSPRPKTSSPSSAVQIIATFIVASFRLEAKPRHRGRCKSPRGREWPGWRRAAVHARVASRRVHGVDRRVARHRGEPGGDGAAARREPATAPLPWQGGTAADAARDLAADARGDAARSARAAP